MEAETRAKTSDNHQEKIVKKKEVVKLKKRAKL